MLVGVGMNRRDQNADFLPSADPFKRPHSSHGAQDLLGRKRPLLLLPAAFWEPLSFAAFLLSLLLASYRGQDLPEGLLPGAGRSRMRTRTRTASLELGLGCAWPAAYLAFIYRLNLVLILHFCWILVLAPDSVLHFKCCFWNFPLGPRPPWSWLYVLAVLGMVPVLCAGTAAPAVTDSVIIDLDFWMIDLGFLVFKSLRLKSVSSSVHLKLSYLVSISLAP